MKTRKHAIQKQPLKTFQPDSIQFYSLAKGWYVLERVAVASLSLVISTNLRTPCASSPRSLPHLSPFFLMSVVQSQGCVFLCPQTEWTCARAPHMQAALHGTHALSQVGFPPLSLIRASVTPDPHHACSLHRPAFLWESLLHTSWSSFQVYLFLSGG